MRPATEIDAINQTSMVRKNKNSTKEERKEHKKESEITRRGGRGSRGGESAVRWITICGVWREREGIGMGSDKEERKGRK